MRLAASSLFLASLCTFTVHANVQFDVTQTSSTYLNSSPLTQVSWLPMHLLDISADLYSAPCHADSTRVTHLAIKGNQILVRDDRDWIVFNLDTRTATIFVARKKTYEVVSLSQPPDPAPRNLHYWAHPTGLTAHINGQQATRYDVLSTSVNRRG